MSPQDHEKLGTALAMHGGINTGLVVTADVAPEKGAHRLAGDAVSVSSRLSGLANPRRISSFGSVRLTTTGLPGCSIRIR